MLRQPFSIRYTALVPSLFLLVGCGADLPPADLSTERDSAGIQIVENAEPRDGALGGWHVDDEPLLELGALDGDPAEQFFRISSVIRLSDGRTVIGDGGSGELRIFGAGGEHRATAGGEGDGPGEFRALTSLHRLPGDTILAYDNGLRRISYYDADARFVRATALAAEDATLRLVDAFGDGTILASVSNVAVTRGEVPSSGLIGDSTLHVRVDLQTEQRDTIGWLPDSKTMIQTTSSGGQVTGVTILRLPFLRTSYIGAIGEEAYSAVSDRYQVGLHAPDRPLARIVRRAAQPEPFTEEYARELFLSQRSPEDVDPAELRDVFPGVPRPGHLPVLRGVKADTEGYLWVERFRWPDDDQPVWDVFDPEGRIVAVVRTPEGLRIEEIGADYMTGVWHDELDVEHVRVYRLERG